MSPQSSSSNGGGGRNGSNGGGFPPPPPPFTTSSRSPQFFSDVPSSASSAFSSSSSSTSTTSTSDTTTITGLLSATSNPQASALSTTSQNGLPLGLIIGASVGGMILGALIVTLLFYWRRRAQRKARRSQALLVGFGDNQDPAEKGFLITPFPPPATPTPPTNAKVVDWMRRNAHNRAVSVSTISSFSSPTVIESVGEQSSISAYSQLSALRSAAGDNSSKPDGRSNRPPPGLYSINE